ncbi:MAG TPA: NAD-dependent epimerase/dehydratase family protein, partial [Lacunisphaera sp.]|nr:NAD-dependent epimerase/dehydratase family protein [Lacunisphaera sp.]
MPANPTKLRDPIACVPPTGLSALITGGAGFIGSNLADLLLAKGWRVRVLDNLSSGNIANLPAGHQHLEFISGDIRDATTVRDACAGIDSVFHLAALVSVIESIKSPQLAKEINVDGTRNVFAGAAAAGVRRVVFSSSCAVYGDAPGDPQHEGLPPAPTSPYAATKLAGETLAAQFGARGLSVISLRYFNVYGPRQNPASDYAAVVPRFLDLALRRQAPTIYGDGEQIRDFIYVGDVARANLLAAEFTGEPPA